MGSGQSNANLESHLNKWETALSELEHLSRANRRAMEQDRIYGGNAGVGEGRGSAIVNIGDDDALEPSLRGTRRSSQVSFGTSQQRPGHTPPEGSVRAVGVSYVAQSSGNNNVSSASCGVNMSADASKAASMTGAQPKHNRQQVLDIKKARTTFFKSYELSKTEEQAGMEESHFATTAAALSYLLGGERGCKDRKKRVTVEDIFFVTHVPLHYLHSGVQPLQVMKDVIREFIDVDNRFKNEYGMTVTHFDISPTIGQVELGSNDVGDRQRRVQLPEFCKVITYDCEETQVIRIVNYDPYVLEQETLFDAFDDEDDGNGELGTSFLSRQRPAARHHKNNNGTYAVIVDVRNVVQLMVTLAVGLMGDGVSVRTIEVSAAALFKAMSCSKSEERPRGYIRIFRKDSVPTMVSDEVPLMFTPELSSGKVLGSTLQGTHASAVSTHVSPHIVAVGWAMHLLGGVRPNSHGYGNGLPVSDIVRCMQFPSEIFIDCSLPLEEVFKYAREYVRLTNRNFNVAIYPVLTRISRADAVPTISVFDLESIIIDVKNANEDPEAPEHVMIIMYNANVAHNVLNITTVPQWCLLAGYDQETQMALLIDANQKMFSQTWTCPLDRLHKAMTSNGYIMFSKSREAASRNKSSESSTCGGSQVLGSFVTDPSLVGAPRRIASTVQNRLELLQEQENLPVASVDVVKSFRFPLLPLAPTMIALALCKLGVKTTFEDVILTLPYEISSLMLRYFTVEALGVSIFTYMRRAKIPCTVRVHHCDQTKEGKPRLSLEEFTQMIVDCLSDKNKVLIILFGAESIEVFGAAQPFGCMGMIVGYNKEMGSVTVTDTDPNSYFRSWPVQLDTLYKAMQDTEPKHRRYGCIALTHHATTEDEASPKFPMEYLRDFSLHVLPVQNIFHVNPSPHFHALSLAFAQLGFFYSPEEIFYEAYLKTMDDQRRRGSQAFAWRDVDVSLSVINKQIDARFLAQVCRMFLESRNTSKGGKANLLKQATGASGGAGNEESIHVELLDDIDLDDLDIILKDASKREGNNSVLLLNYDTAKAHDVPDWGRSVALIGGYNPDTEEVLLWESEYSVFGMTWKVDMDKLIEIGDLNNEGHSPYGFVKMEKSKGPMGKKKLQLMKGPDPDEDPNGTNGHATRRNRDVKTMFVGNDVS